MRPFVPDRLYWLLTRTAWAVPFALAMSSSYEHEGNGGILSEIGATGALGSIAILAGFFAAVALFARDLQRCLDRIPEDLRAIAPKRVWAMFLLPINFVEDFFIVTATHASIARVLSFDPVAYALNERCRAYAISWCALQILSLSPGTVGIASGFLAAVFWILHWHGIRRLLTALEAVPLSLPQDPVSEISIC